MRILTLVFAMAVSYACSSSASAPKTPILASVKVLSGGSQQGTVGAALPSPIIIQALDSSGHPVAKLGVAYGPSDGSVTPVSAFTDSTGKASTSWMLGSHTGPDTLFVAVTQDTPGSGAPIATVVDTIYATANP